MKILILGDRGTKGFIYGKQENRYPWEGIMHVLIISPFIRKEQQLTFYANETSTLHGRLSRDREHIYYRFHPDHLGRGLQSILIVEYFLS